MVFSLLIRVLVSESGALVSELGFLVSESGRDPPVSMCWGICVLESSVLGDVVVKALKVQIRRPKR